MTLRHGFVPDKTYPVGAASRHERSALIYYWVREDRWVFDAYDRLMQERQAAKDAAMRDYAKRAGAS